MLSASLRVLLQKYKMHYTLAYITSNGYGRGEGGNSLVIFYLSAQRSIYVDDDTTPTP